MDMFSIRSDPRIYKRKIQRERYQGLLPQEFSRKKKNLVVGLKGLDAKTN
jgi:hypothetical protein